MASKDETAHFLQQEIERLTVQKETAEATAVAIRANMDALIAEFTDTSDEDTPDKIRKNIRGRIPAALTVLDEIMLNGSDHLKASIARYFIDRGLETTEGSPGHEAEKFEKFLKTLT